MARWDCKWKERMGDNNLVVDDDGRYVDDARDFMYPIRAGWRWLVGGLWFTQEWEREDDLLSPIESSIWKSEWTGFHSGDRGGFWGWMVTYIGVQTQGKCSEHL